MLCFGGSEHVLVYAPTRAGKGAGYVIPDVLNWVDSVVVLDVKKENWQRSAGFRAAHGSGRRAGARSSSPHSADDRPSPRPKHRR
nr:type IV secretory system conjugative DNA transfer family protein [Bradyrhizobium viridifuturi]